MISVIIPTFNEAGALPDTLRHLLALAGRFETLVVDGGSTDATVALAQSYPTVRTLTAHKGRARQMNAGAAQARGDWLLFLHADTRLPEHALTRIAALPDDVRAGGFRHRFSGDSAVLRVISALDNYRCRKTGVVYGDQALFVRRGLFETLGGFPDVVMEDVRFCEQLAIRTRLHLFAESVITDSRKFDTQGHWRSLARVLFILACDQLRRPPPVFTRRFFEDVR